MIALGYVVALTLFIRANSGDADTSSNLARTSPGLTTPALPSASASRSASASGSPSAPGSSPNGLDLSTLPQHTIIPRIPGGFTFGSVPSHKLVLSATSARAIKRLGYLVPTSFDSSYGDIRNVGRSWSVTTTVYGNPAYAEVFIQSGSDGVPITCSITVDGVVTNSATTKGPYGRQVCIG